jgi:hypothetical protein
LQLNIFSHDLDKYREWRGLPDISIEKQFNLCSGKTTKESATIDAEYDGSFLEKHYVPSSTRGDYSPSNSWDAPGICISVFI